MTFDLDIWPTDMNIYRGHLLIKDYLPTKFEASGAKRFWVISCTRWSRLAWPLTLGCSSVIVLCPKMGVAPHKHDVISMPTQKCTHTKHISIERYHPVVSIMLRYLDQIKTFGENLCCRKVKIDKIFWMTYRTLLSNATTFRKDCERKRSVQMKHIS